MKKPVIAKSTPDTILLVEGDVLQRTSIAAYLRHCGYRVIEAAQKTEALALLSNPRAHIDILFSEINIPTAGDGFALAQWVRKNRLGVHIILTGDLEGACENAGKLCESGPHLKKPYEPQQVLSHIKQLRATAKRQDKDTKDACALVPLSRRKQLKPSSTTA